MEITNTEKGPVAIHARDAREIADTGDFLDLLVSAGPAALVLETRHLPAVFFDLSTGVAGEWLQKVSTYRKRLVILGDFTQVSRKSLRDFILESNRTGQVVFARDLETALPHLTRVPGQGRHS